MGENHSDCFRVVQHALVLGPSCYAESNPSVPAQHAQSADPAFQSDPSQESVKSKPSCMALADPGGVRTPPLKNNLKGFNPKYKIISWC